VNSIWITVKTKIKTTTAIPGKMSTALALLLARIVYFIANKKKFQR
jgi:hypothetical protein